MIAVLEKIWLEVVMAYYPGICQEGLKVMNEPQDVVCQASTQTGHLLNTSLVHYSYTTLLSVMLS